MSYQNKYRTKSLRLKGWNYSNLGSYYVTICTKRKKYYFGDIRNRKMILNGLGKIAEEFLIKIPEHNSNVEIDYFIVMPNHIHLIIIIFGKRSDVACNVATNTNKMSMISPKAGSLSTIIRSHKSAVTKWAKQNDHCNFAWQPRFYEHIIRNKKSLFQIRKYIKLNPLKWEIDKENPINN